MTGRLIVTRGINELVFPGKISSNDEAIVKENTYILNVSCLFHSFHSEQYML
jgi:hypothetical protein